MATWRHTADLGLRLHHPTCSLQTSRLVVLRRIQSPSVGRCARPLTPARPVIKKQPILISVGGHITVPLHIPRTPFSLALTALFVSDSKGVLLCCVASLFPPFLFGREGTQRWTGSSRPNARRNLFEPLTTSPDTWTTGGSAERSMGAAFGLRALTHLSRPPQAIWGFVMLGFAPVCIRQVRN